MKPLRWIQRPIWVSVPLSQSSSVLRFTPTRTEPVIDFRILADPAVQGSIQRELMSKRPATRRGIVVCLRGKQEGFVDCGI